MEELLSLEENLVSSKEKMYRLEGLASERREVEVKFEGSIMSISKV